MPKSYTIKASPVKDFSAAQKEREEAARKRAEARSQGPKYPTLVKDDPIVVRLLADPDNGGWLEYGEYWDNEIRQSVIALEENEDEYSERNMYPKSKYLVPALVVETNEVRIFKLTTTMAQELDRIRGKWGSLTEYDVELSRSGVGTDTKYHADPVRNMNDNLDLSQIQIPDLMKFLERQVNDQLGLDDVDTAEDDVPNDTVTEEEKKPAPRKLIRKVAR